MEPFRQDNTKGFTDDQLVRMNARFNYLLSKAMVAGGASSHDHDAIDKIKQSLAEATLKEFGGDIGAKD